MPITFRAELPGAPWRVTVRPYRIAGLWYADGAWGPSVMRGPPRDAAEEFARRHNWPPAPLVEVPPGAGEAS